MTACPTDAVAAAARREAATHGCCCKGCSVRAEIWACFWIDVSSIVGLLLEIPGWAPVPASLHAVDVFRFYLAFSVCSAGLILFAMLEREQKAWPRRALVRLMSVKLPVFVLVVMGYFLFSPWAAPLARWICGHDFQQMRSVMTGGTDLETCVRLEPWVWTANNAIYILAYAYTLKASHDWFRCHPGNDGKGIWCARAAPPREGDDYTNLAEVL